MSMSSNRLPTTGQNQPEISLPLEEKQLAALYAGVTDAVYIEEPKSGRILYWSTGAAALFGFSSAEILAQTSARVMTEEKATGESLDVALAQLESAGTWRGLRQYRRADGSVFDAQVVVSSLPAERGICAVVVVRASGEGRTAKVTDVQASAPERASAEQMPGRRFEGKHDEQVIGHLLRNIANFAVITTGTDGNISEWNREATRLFGYERGEIFGKHISIICADDSARALQKTFEDAREKGASRYSQWMLRKGGKRFYARVAVFAVWDDTRVQGFLFLLTDDSRAPNLSQMLREKEQMAAIGTAASILAHEIGNPLNGISATVQLLEHFLSRDTLPPAASLLSSVHDLKSEVRRLTALLNEFKNIAWPQKLALAPVDLPKLIKQLVGAVENRSARQNVIVSIECQPGLPLLNGDDDKLKQALLQVLDNAFDAMPHGGKLQIKAYKYEETICIDVIDTGVGIPKNLKAFDLFSSTKPDGIGLGLFMVQQIVLAHGGAVTYSSTPGQGTTFHVTFTLHPLHDPLGADFIETI
jgi:PAS domain S-box-containing protein